MPGAGPVDGQGGGAPSFPTLGQNQNVLPSGVMLHALEAAVAAVPCLVVGECWTSHPSRPELAAFFSPTPLVARHTEADGRPASRVVDFALAAAFAPLHKLSIRLAERAAASGLVEWCHDMTGDELLARLTFRVGSAIAVPVLATGPGPRRCACVLVFYSGERVEVSRQDGGRKGSPGRPAGGVLARAGARARARRTDARENLNLNPEIFPPSPPPRSNTGAS